MKSVLISIRPKWVELIASGKKTIEVRKTRPKLEPPFKCYIYETKGKVERPCGDEDGYIYQEGRGAVVGEFVCDEIARYARYGYAGTLPRYMRSSQGGYPATEIHYSSLQLSPVDLERYGKGTPLYGWHISALKMYDKPLWLSQMTVEKRGRGFYIRGPVTRPPQSYMYVEELANV